MNPRSGICFDVHRFRKGRKLVLGGVLIPHSKGLDGHSDADVLVHAVMDALLGSVGESDIGHFFPNTDSKWKNVSSLKMLGVVADVLRKKRARIINIDSTIIAQAPKIAPYIPEMKKKMAEVLGIKAGDISVKATTSERLGALGRAEGMAAMAVVSVLAGGKR
jgi:2-C-methyl-D-erythritol 2,4-cyclodiphosphate synthase